MRLLAADVRAYLDRQWGSLQESTAQNRAERQQEDPEWSWRVAIALREDVVRHNPGWPTDEDRARDLVHHLDLIDILDRASHELSCRSS